MNKDTYDTFYNEERGHWWFVGKRYLVFNFINKYIKIIKDKKLKILDVGCGTGIVGEKLRKFGEVYGLDNSNDAICFCKKRGFDKAKLGSIDKIPFKDANFDFVTCLDVLYHKGIDDILALKEISRILVNGGYLFITDAAMKCLWSKHDIIHHSRTRYSSIELRSKLEKAGFEIKKMSYFNTFLFPFIYISRKISNILNLKPSSDIKKTNRFINYLLLVLYHFELSLVNYFNYPFGVSIFVAARKK